MDLNAIKSRSSQPSTPIDRSGQVQTPQRSGDVSVIADRRLLKMDAQGAETRNQIKELQTMLVKDGELQPGQFNVGTFDQTMKQAVVDYQTKNNLKIDGVVGQQTWGALNGIDVEPGTDKLKGGGEPEGWAGAQGANGTNATRRTPDADPAVGPDGKPLTPDQQQQQVDPNAADPQYGASDDQLRQASQIGSVKSLGTLGAGIVETKVARWTKNKFAEVNSPEAKAYRAEQKELRAAAKAEAKAAKAAGQEGAEGVTKEGGEIATKEGGEVAKAASPELEAASKAATEATAKAEAKATEAADLAAKAALNPADKVLAVQAKNAGSEAKVLASQAKALNTEALKLADYASKPVRLAEEAEHAANAAKIANANVKTLETEAADWAAKAAANPKGASIAKSAQGAKEALATAKTEARQLDTVAARAAERAAKPAKLVEAAMDVRKLAADSTKTAELLESKAALLTEKAAKDPKKWSEAAKTARKLAKSASTEAKSLTEMADSAEKVAIRSGGSFAKVGETATEAVTKGTEVAAKTGLVAGAKNLVKSGMERAAGLSERTGLTGLAKGFADSKLGKVIGDEAIIGRLKKPAAALLDRAKGIVSVIRNGSKGAAEIAAKKTVEAGTKATVEAGTKATVEAGTKALTEAGTKALVEGGSKAAAEGVAKGVAEGGAKLALRSGGRLAQAIPFAGTAVAIGFAAYDIHHAVQVQKDPHAPTGKKVLAWLTAGASSLSVIPGIGIISSVVSTASSVAEGVMYP